MSGSPRVRITPATLAHAEVLAILHTACFQGQPWHRGWNSAQMAQILALPGFVGWIAMDPADTPTGLMLVQQAGPEADILTLGVRPGRWRRQGIARALLCHGHAALAGAGVDRIVLEVAADNGAAVAFYSAAGYESVGRRARYYENHDTPAKDRADALIMALALPDRADRHGS